jgi:HEAT repeat protein
MLKEEKRFEAQQDVFRAITLIGSRDVPGLLKSLKEINNDGRWAIPFALKQFGARPADALPPLVRNLNHRDPITRLAAALALGELGKDAAPAVPALAQALQDPNLQVRSCVTAALARIDASRAEAARKQFEFALERVTDKMLALASARVALNLQEPQPVLPGKLPRPVNRRAFTDPLVQAQYDEVVGLHLFLSVCRPTTSGIGKTALMDNSRFKDLYHAVSTLIDLMEPEAIPALVRGLNQTAQYNLGFC